MARKPKEPVDAGDESQVKKRKSASELQKLNEAEALRDLLKSYSGRSFIWRLLTQCGIYDSSFTGVDTLTFFNEGKRHIGLLLLEDIFEADPNAYTILRNEAAKRKNKGK